MGDLKLLSIEPGNIMPTHDDAKMKENTLGATPDCPDCGANHYMHDSPDEDTLNLICMSCGAVHNVTGIEGRE